MPGNDLVPFSTGYARRADVHMLSLQKGLPSSAQRRQLLSPQWQRRKAALPIAPT